MSAPDPSQPPAVGLYDVGSNDPNSQLIDRTGIDPASMAQIGSIMQALGALRDAEEKLAEASLAYMKLGRTDMRALHYLIVTSNSGQVVTPGAIAAHLKISTASTTKLLDRLERGGHITRSIHPSDRRAFAIEITPETREAAMQTVGRQQAKRFHAAARLTGDEREVVARFLTDMARELDVSGEPWAEGLG
ncbi:MarR family winged helix-turn-helix transcriptional regulator [Leucobacter sp. HY1910]